MTVEYWCGGLSQHKTEQNMLSGLFTHLKKQPDHYWMLANFHVQNEIDLVVIKRTGIFLAELKHIWSPISGGKNGPWRFEKSDGAPVDFKNPYLQTRANAFQWKDFVLNQRDRWLEPAHRTWTDTMLMPYAFIVISPHIAEGSKIKIHPDPIEVRPIEQFMTDLVMMHQPGIDLSRAEVHRLLGLLNLGCEAGEQRPTFTATGPQIIARPGVRQLAPCSEEAGTKVFHLNKTEIKVGRGLDNDLVLEHQQVSNRHALIRLDDEFWTIEDLGSKNGTWVRYNGEEAAERKIEHANAIKNGSIIRFGPCFFQVMIVEPAGNG